MVRDRQGGQLSVSTTGDKRWDTIVWLDHRAIAEADECTASGHARARLYRRRHVAGDGDAEADVAEAQPAARPGARPAISSISTDFLTWQATGSLARSQCTLTAKWTYLAHEETGWQRDFFEVVGLDDLFEHGNLPERASPVGADHRPADGARRRRSSA